jgi:hypothetical protein
MPSIDVNQPRDGVGRQRDLPGARGPDRPRVDIDRRRLREVGAGAGPNRFERQGLVVDPRQDDGVGIGPPRTGSSASR